MELDPTQRQNLLRENGWHEFNDEGKTYWMWKPPGALGFTDATCYTEEEAISYHFEATKEDTRSMDDDLAELHDEFEDALESLGLDCEGCGGPCSMVTGEVWGVPVTIEAQGEWTLLWLSFGDHDEPVARVNVLDFQVWIMVDLLGDNMYLFKQLLHAPCMAGGLAKALFGVMVLDLGYGSPKIEEVRNSDGEEEWMNLQDSESPDA